jgi:hypothetical protein
VSGSAGHHHFPDFRRDLFHRLGGGAPHRQTIVTARLTPWPPSRRGRRRAARHRAAAVAPAAESAGPAHGCREFFIRPPRRRPLWTAKPSPGDQFKQYKVKEISKYTVTLIGPDGKIRLGMGD